MKTPISLPLALGAALILSACAFKAPPWQGIDGQVPDAERLAKAKQVCDHDAKFKEVGEIRANAVMVARYEGGGVSGPMAKKHFDKAAEIRQEVWDCMKAHGFVLPQK